MKNAVKMEKFTFESAADGQTLSAVAYSPKKPTGIVQLVHGMSEHVGRYEQMMTFFAENGYVACAHDHRGHGDSVAKNDDLGYFGADGTARALVEDTVQFTRLMKEWYPDLPVYLYGHSMGSMVVRCYIQEHDDEIEKLIVSGSPNANPFVGIAVKLAGAVKAIKGERHRSKTLKSLSTGSSEKRFPEDGDLGWLTSDKAVQQQFREDEKCGAVFTANGFQNLFHVLKNTYDKKRYKVGNPSLPIHFVAGAEDPIIGDEKKWLYGQEMLRKVGYTDVTGKLYEGMRHEPHNEIGKEIVWQDLLDFIEK